jgi:hypothetical protein
MLEHNGSGDLSICGIYHNDPSSSHLVVPISLAVVWDVILNRQNNALTSVTVLFLRDRHH